MSDSSITKPKNYFRIEIFILKVTGLSLSNNEGILYKVYSYITFYIFNLLYCFMSIYVLHGAKITEDAETIAFNTCICLGCTIVMSVMANRIKLRKLLTKLLQEPFLPDTERGGVEEEILIKKWFWLKKMQSYAYYVGVIMFLISGIVYTILKHITSDNPLDWKFFLNRFALLNVTNKINYEICWTYQVVYITLSAPQICAIMVIMYGTLSFACVQLQILQRYLRLVSNRAETRSEHLLHSNRISTNASTSWTYLKPTLKRAVSYHLKILEIITEVEEIFSMIILLIYFGVLGAVCLLLYVISQLPIQDPRTITLIMAAVMICGFPLPLCYWGEQIAHESEQVAIAAFEGYSVDTDFKFQKGLIIVMKRSQRTVRIKAGKLIETSMITYGWILRTAFSYFMVIRNINMKA